MKRRPKLDAGNFPSWEERIDYQIECAFDHCDRLRETDHNLFRRVGELHGRLDRTAASADLIRTQATVTRLVQAVVVLSAVVLALLVLFVWSVLA